MAIQTFDGGHYVAVGFVGDLEASSAPAAAEALKAVLGHRPIVLDLSAVDFMDSAGLGILARARHEAAALGGTVILAGATARLQKILRITRLDKVFPTFDTMAEAVASLEPGQAS